MSWKGIGQFKKSNQAPSVPQNNKFQPSKTAISKKNLNIESLSTNSINFLEQGTNSSLQINAHTLNLNTNQLIIQNDNIVLKNEDLHINTNINTYFYGNTFLECPRYKCFTLANTPQVILNNDLLMQSSYFFLEYKQTSRIVFLKSDLATYNPVDSTQNLENEEKNVFGQEPKHPSFYTHKITFLLQKASKHPHELPEIRVVIQTPVENIIVKFDSPSSSLELLWHPAGEWKVLGLGFKTIIES